MFGQALIYTFYTLVASSVALGLLNWLRANLADLRLDRLRRAIARHPAARHRRRRPLLSVLVFAHNDAALINDCLQSLVSSSYRKLEIIIVDNASTDTTRQLARDFIKAHPNQRLRLVAKRRSSRRAAALASASRHAHGERIAVLDASSLVKPGALRGSLALLAEPNVEAVLANARVVANYRLLGIAGRFRALATIWNKKAGSYITPGLDDYNYAAIYQRELFDRLIRLSTRQALDSVNCLRQMSAAAVYDRQFITEAYGNSPKYTVRPQGRFWNNLLLGWLGVVEPLIIGFMVYVALRFDQPGYLLVAWASFSGLLLMAIWSDDSRGFWSKIGQTSLVPIMYSLYLAERTRAILTIIKSARFKLQGRWLALQPLN